MALSIENYEAGARIELSQFLPAPRLHQWLSRFLSTIFGWLGSLAGVLFEGVLECFFGKPRLGCAIGVLVLVGVLVSWLVWLPGWYQVLAFIQVFCLLCLVFAGMAGIWGWADNRVKVSSEWLQPAVLELSTQAIGITALFKGGRSTGTQTLQLLSDEHGAGTPEVEVSIHEHSMKKSEAKDTPEEDPDRRVFWDLRLKVAGGARLTLPHLLCTPAETETVLAQLQYFIDRAKERQGQGVAEVPEALRELEERPEIEAE